MIDLPRSDLIDAHAHVWDRSCDFVPGARYRPDYEATIDTYLRVLDAHGIARAVLVQPSFLGTDNRYLLDCLRTHPDRLRGIVVVDPRITDQALADMAGMGVIGHRYNMVGRDPGVLRTGAYRDLTARATAFGWWTEVQAKGEDWPDIADLLRSDGARVMVDHFGLPSALTCRGIAALEDWDADRLCVKLSAPYRQSCADYVHAARRLTDSAPEPALAWGSDWPWTQHEGRHVYADCLAWLESWTDDRARATISAALGPLGF
ncbi:MAG: amidohydrolase family protein [Pseudomonadota bacterium]